MDFELLTGRIVEIVRECGAIVSSADRSALDVSCKAGRGNFVTKYDEAVQRALKERLLALLPKAVFYGEEGEASATDPTKGLAFIVDPIDGTCNFMRGFRECSISVALALDGVIQCGVVYTPLLGDMYYATRGHGAFRNGESIRVSSLKLADGLVLFGSAPYYSDVRDTTKRLLSRFIDCAQDVRRIGSAALDLCLIAAGNAELFFESMLCPWDYAAGSVILEEAGGKVTAFDGTPLPLSRRSSVLATNSHDFKL